MQVPFIKHTFLDARQGEPAEFRCQLTGFERASHLSSFPKLGSESFQKLTCQACRKNFECLVDDILCANISTNTE